VKQLEKQAVIEGEPATFTCEVAKVTSDMPITWLRDGKPLPADSGCQVSTVDKVLTLHIPKTVLDDEAEYTVVVGKTKSTAELLVDGESITVEDYHKYLTGGLFLVVKMKLYCGKP